MTTTNAKLFVNGKIFTSKKGDDSLYQAMLIQDDKVLYVGDDQGARQVAQEVRTVSHD